MTRMTETEQHHLRAVTAAGLDPDRVLRDVHLAEDCEHLVVTELTTDPDHRVLFIDGEPVVKAEHVVPIDEDHPWWRDMSSMLPRVVVVRPE